MHTEVQARQRDERDAQRGRRGNQKSGRSDDIDVDQRVARCHVLQNLQEQPRTAQNQQCSQQREAQPMALGVDQAGP